MRSSNERHQTPRRSFHVWDPEEEYVSQCKDMSGYFLNKEARPPHDHLTVFTLLACN